MKNVTLSNHIKSITSSKVQAMGDNQWIGVQPSPKLPSSRNKDIWLGQTSYHNPQTRMDDIELFPSPVKASAEEAGMRTAFDIISNLLKHNADQKDNTYERQCEEQLGQILTNRYKLSHYKQKIEREMTEQKQPVAKNYKMLLLLLDQVARTDIEVEYSKQGVSMRFNQAELRRQEDEIDRLNRQKVLLEKETEKIVKEYEAIIGNFNSVIEKLLSGKQGRSK